MERHTRLIFHKTLLYVKEEEGEKKKQKQNKKKHAETFFELLIIPAGYMHAKLLCISLKYFHDPSEYVNHMVMRRTMP